MIEHKETLSEQNITQLKQIIRAKAPAFWLGSFTSIAAAIYLLTRYFQPERDSTIILVWIVFITLIIRTLVLGIQSIRINHDLRENTKQIYEGTLSQKRIYSLRASGPVYQFFVEGRKFQIAPSLFPREKYDTIVNGKVRVEAAPHSRILFNIRNSENNTPK